MPTISGKSGMIYLQGSGSDATKLGEARTWQIDIDCEYEDTTNFGAANAIAPWATSDLEVIRWGGQAEGNFDTAETSPFDAVVARSAKKIYIYPAVAWTGNRYYYGTIWPRLTIKGGIKGTVRFELEWDGTGEIGVN